MSEPRWSPDLDRESRMLSRDEATETLLRRLAEDSDGLTAEDIIVNVRAELARWPERQSAEQQHEEQAAIQAELVAEITQELGEEAGELTRSAYQRAIARRRS